MTGASLRQFSYDKAMLKKSVKNFSKVLQNSVFIALEAHPGKKKPAKPTSELDWPEGIYSKSGRNNHG